MIGSLPHIQSPHTLSTNEVVANLQSDEKKGLTQVDAKFRLKTYGPNALEVEKPRTRLNVFLSQFLNALVWVLFVAAALAFAFHEWLEGSAILVVIVINAIIGYYMEIQAIRSMDALKKLAITVVKVYRNGDLIQLPSEELVPGDVIFFEAGDMVPADCRLLEVHSLGVSEAALTGESTLVTKRIDMIPLDTPVADRTNMVFKGTAIARGNALGLVVETGKNTELGKIVELTQHATKETTPLEKKLNILSKKLIGLTLVLAAGIMVIGLLQGRDTFLMIETSIALAIAAIPEGLPIVATIALARGVLRLSRHQVIVKKLSAVETLGETEVIFTDKTGTLTENQLLPDVLMFDFDQASISLRESNIDFHNKGQQFIEDTFAFDQMVKVSCLCNNASLDDNGGGVGDPLEVALLKFTDASGNNISLLKEDYPRLHEIPFDSDTKMMGTLHRNGKRPDFLVCIKGALEVVLEESDYVLTRSGKKPLRDKNSWMDEAEKLASKGLRVLAVAYAEIDKPNEDFFHNLIFVGCIGFMDPPIREIPEAIKTCQRAGVRVVMVTGDHHETARNIACRVGLEDEESCKVVRGGSFGRMEIGSEINIHNFQKTNVFARVTPAQKLELVKLYQGFGKTVGMIGDGVNDTPALKKADIGIAMGGRGTEAAKEVADLVLKNDAFDSIVVAIKQGRGIFENIRHFVVYLLSCNLSELLLVAMAFFFNLPMPLLPLQILFINMVTDVFPAFALGMNKEPDTVMDMPPRKKNTPIVTRERWISIIVYALSITFAALSALLFASFFLKTSDMLANNFAFYTLILAQLWHVFNLPEHFKSFINNEITRNKFVWMAILISVIVMVIAYISPILNEVLNLAEFKLEYLFYVIIFSLLPVVLIRIIKMFRWIV